MVTPVVLERKVSGETTTHHAMGPAYFNSFLDTTGISPTKNARLTITLRVAMCPIGPGTDMDIAKWIKGATNGRVKNLWDDNWVICSAWDDATYNQFGNEVKRQAESFWSSTDATWGNQGFTLINVSKDWPGLNVPISNPTHRANVECDFHIEWAKGMRDAHIAVYVARLPTGAKTICSWMTPGTEKDTGRGFLSTTSLSVAKFGLCSSRLSSGTCTPSTTNAVIAHEIGHAIGLPHIGLMNAHSTCSKEVEGGRFDRFLRALRIKGYDTNLDSCYNGETPADTANVMGKGSTIGTGNIDPWRIRIAQHTHTQIGDWGCLVKPVAPLPLAVF